MSAGERIRKLRKSRGWTQDELAERAGMNGRHLSRFETGQLEPPLRTLRRIAEAFEVPVEELTEENPQERLATLVPDPELLEQFQVLSRMDEEDRKAVKRVLSAVIMRDQMQKMLVGQST